MNNARRALLPVILLFIALALISPAQAQTAHRTTATDPLTMLPASDVVLVIDHSRIWSEAIPHILGKDFPPLAKIMAEAEQFRTKTGIDVRSISRIAVGVRFMNPEGMMKKMDKKDIAIVIIGQGDFDANKFVDFMRREEKGKVREAQQGGQIIYTIEESSKGGATRPDTEKPALAVLDANTIALGDLAQVRATVDAKGGSGRLSPDLLALVTRNSNALISLAGNVPPQLAAHLAPKGSSGNTDLDKTVSKFFEAVASIKQMHMSLGTTAAGVEAWLGARFSNTEQAQSLGDMLLGARQQYSVFIEDKILRDFVNNMQITAQGDEVQLRAELPQTTIAMLLENAKKKAAAKKTEANQAATPATQTETKKKSTGRSKRRKRS